MIGRERIEALIECRTSSEVMAKLAEYGITVPSAESEAVTMGGMSRSAETGAMREGMLLDLLRRAYTEVETAVPDPAPYRAFRYPYDVNNLKVAVKCAVRDIRDLSATDLLFDFGTVPAADVEAVVREGREADVYPPAMADAVGCAKEAYAATGDPRLIDAILDRACYVDMLSTLALAGDKTMTGWMQAKIDLLNIVICLRILRMKRGDAGRDFLSDTLLPGGTLQESFFYEAYATGEEGLWRALSSTSYAALCRWDGSEPSLRAVEKAADDLWMERVRDGARIPFGAAVAGGYLIGWETAVRNIRIVLAAKDAGLSNEALRERIRVSYV